MSEAELNKLARGYAEIVLSVAKLETVIEKYNTQPKTHSKVVDRAVTGIEKGAEKLIAAMAVFNLKRELDTAKKANTKMLGSLSRKDDLLGELQERFILIKSLMKDELNENFYTRLVLGEAPQKTSAITPTHILTHAQMIRFIARKIITLSADRASLTSSPRSRSPSPRAHKSTKRNN